MLGLLGPNGAGKTTTVRMLTTLSVPTSGTGRVAGHDILTEPDAVRRSMGLTGQAATVDELLTGRENIRLIGRLYGLPHEVHRADRPTSCSSGSRSTDAADRIAKTYSGGMRRRLDLAVSLVAAPPVLFLDEPTTGLDPRSRAELWEVLRELVRDGTTLLLTTQYLEEADQLADEIIVIDKGQVIAAGTPTSSRTRPGEASVVAHGHRTRRTSTRGRADAPRARRRCTSSEAARRLTAQADGLGDMTRIARGLRGQRHRASTTSGCKRPSLDDVFLHLTGHRAEAETRRRPSRPTPRRRPCDDRRRPPGRRPTAAARSSRRRCCARRSTVVWRNLIHIKRMPEMLLDVTIQPVMFVLLFAFVFGGSIAVPGVELPGVPAARDHGADDGVLLVHRGHRA